jgi:membrane associated rhomboid family serine protease
MADPEVDTTVEELERCYRHPNEVTRVHCTRCGNPICPACMHPAPVGHHCPTCVANARRDARVPVARRAKGAAMALGRPGAITSVLLAANLTVFVAEIIASRGALLGLTRGGTATLVEMGGAVPLAIAGGERWRLLTAMFLHASLIHIAFNSLVLYQLGNVVERTFGRLRMIAIYLVGGFLASVASYIFSPVIGVSVGASGAVFALAGAWLAYNWRRRDLAFSAMNVRSIWLFLAINLVIGFSIPGIDNSAHIGGFVAGVLAGTVAEGFGPRRTRALVGAAGLLALVAIGVALVQWRTDQILGGLGLPGF